MTKNVLGNSLKSLNQSKTKDDEFLPLEKSTIKPKRDMTIGIVFRLGASDHEVITKYAYDLGMSVQELIEVAINSMRRAHGLSELEGRPRSKTRCRLQHY